MASNKFYIVKVSEFENTPWFQMKAQYAAATAAYNAEIRRPLRKGEDPRIVRDMAIKTFLNECDSIKAQHPDVDTYPVPLTINGKQYLDSVDGTKRLIQDRYGSIDHPSLDTLSYRSSVYDQKTINPLLSTFR